MPGKVRTWNDYVAMHTSGVRIKAGSPFRVRRGSRFRRVRRNRQRRRLARLLFWLP